MIVRSAGSKGRGVFATMAWKKGKLALREQVLPIKPKDADLVNKSILGNYAFYLSGRYMLCLGLGCLINHADPENLFYSFNKKKNTIDFFAARDIKSGEELTIDYGWDKYPWEN